MASRLPLRGILAVVFATFLAASAASAADLENSVITQGTNAGKKLIDVVQNYTVSCGGKRVHIPSRAIQDAFSFYDRYYGTCQSLSYYPLGYLGANSEGYDPASPQEDFVTSQQITEVAPTIANNRYMVIFDLDLRSSCKRLHVIDLQTGEIESTEASHGIGSDPGNTGYARHFVSDEDSKASPLGFFSLKRPFIAPGPGRAIEHRKSLTLEGLEAPSGEFEGNITPTTLGMHEATYVSPGHAGRSDGCPAVNHGFMNRWQDRLTGGTLFYFYHASLDSMGRTPTAGGIQPSVGNCSDNPQERDPRSTQNASKNLPTGWNPWTPPWVPGPGGWGGGPAGTAN